VHYHPHYISCSLFCLLQTGPPAAPCASAEAQREARRPQVEPQPAEPSARGPRLQRLHQRQAVRPDESERPCGVHKRDPGGGRVQNCRQGLSRHPRIAQLERGDHAREAQGVEPRRVIEQLAIEN